MWVKAIIYLVGSWSGCSSSKQDNGTSLSPISPSTQLNDIQH